MDGENNKIVIEHEAELTGAVFHLKGERFKDLKHRGSIRLFSISASCVCVCVYIHVHPETV